ncbi:MAG: RNA 2',3'-cyclic phosphodiesterase [Oscillospiraceae bacterium]|nr:RNA 2',3'-cyclic phosphodiesterase [Oscillospiraceae bacterium]
MMRLFIAINFKNEMINRLVALRDELKETSSRGRFAQSENLHLTLVFIGECDVEQTAMIKSIMDTITFEPFDLTVDRVGCFKRDSGDIWWAGVRKSDSLLELYENLTSKLQESGFKLEKYKYSPHITLGRNVVTKANPQQIEPFGETVSIIDFDI